MKKVLANLKKILTNNIGIKILAVIFAFVLWLAVVNINDPERVITVYNVPITITDSEVLKEQNMVYSAVSDYSVNITVSGKRSVVSNLTPDDFVATASLKDLSKVNSVPVNVEAKSISTGRRITIMKQSIQTVEVSVEQITETEFDIEAEFHGSMRDGYVLGEYSLYTNKITIDAPNSVLDRIDKVAAVCNVENVSEDIQGQKCKIVLYDKKGQKINIKKNNITMSMSRVKINVNILKEKTLKILPVTIDNVGQPAKDCLVTDVKLLQDEITVIGTADIIDSLKDLDISGQIDLSKDDKDVTKTVDVSTLLPQEITISSGNIISIEVKIDKYTTRSITIEPQDVALQNVAEGYGVSVISKVISIEFSGKESVLDDIKPEDIAVSVDLTGVVAVGTQVVKATIDCPDTITPVNDVSVKVKIKKK